MSCNKPSISGPVSWSKLLDSMLWTFFSASLTLRSLSYDKPLQRPPLRAVALWGCHAGAAAPPPQVLGDQTKPRLWVIIFILEHSQSPAAMMNIFCKLVSPKGQNKKLEILFSLELRRWWPFFTHFILSLEICVESVSKLGSSWHLGTLEPVRCTWVLVATSEFGEIQLKTSDSWQFKPCLH